MSISADTLRLHIAYTTWATNLLLDAAADLTPEELSRDFGSSEKTVSGTLAHIYAADRVWMGRIQGVNPKLYVHEDERDLAVLSRAWPPLLKQWKTWAGALTDESVDNQVDYTNPKGNPDRTPHWQIVLHVVNHGTHHRGQVSGFLRAMGKVPPALDLVAFYRELAQASLGPLNTKAAVK
jgi:uncharacterized damage-inducible protein DinB